MENKKLSPKEFLRARRPEKFSDSNIEQSAILDRSILEYHLDSLTSRKQEISFENFAHRLTERTICPNLVPQTGPTGGGDSKVDTETYPVADSLSLIWYEGIGQEAASERWAFAFSAKKRWQPKVHDDVKKIVETRRGYKKAFFISNQFISDRNRAKTEDELREEYDLDVRILDRTWILNKIFENNLEGLAIEELGLEISTRREVQKGPLDIQRERKLDELEERIEDAIQQGNYNFSLAEDCLNSAIYSRNLERPRIEIDGRFERAERIAKKCGTSHQILECAYEKAWTTFWWHEDFSKFIELYTNVEVLANNSRNVYDLELLTNLWFLLYGMALGEKFSKKELHFQSRTETLLTELERLSKEENRPSTSLQAQTLSLQIQLALKQYKKEPIDEVLKNLQDVIQQAERYPGYPLEPLVEIFTEMGEFLEDVPAYDELFETIVKISSSHKGEISGAQMLLKRGEQQLNAKRPYEVIRTLGRTFTSLYKHESREDAVFSLYLCACAYEQVGLLWAAHGTMLNAASLAINEYWKYGDITPSQAACYSRLKWIELQLGRIPHILAWHEVDSVVRAALAEQGYEMSRMTERDQDFDAILGMLLLKTDIWSLKRLSKLPDTLDELGLLRASITLLYSLGHEEEFLDDNHRNIFGGEDTKSFFQSLYSQPASEDLPEIPAVYDESKVQLKSNILGCEIEIESENSSPCIELAESLLAALESLLSTAMSKHMIAREPNLFISIGKSEFAKKPFEFSLRDQNGKPEGIIACSSFDPQNMPLEQQGEIKKNLFETIASILARVLMISDIDKDINELFHEEHGLDRSMSFTGSFVTIGNVLGYTPKFSLEDWLKPEAHEYPLNRSEPWNADYLKMIEEAKPSIEKPSFASNEEELPADLLDPENFKHSQIRTFSLIRETLWERAGWSATAFYVALDNSTLPVIAPVFKDEKIAKEIFAQWRNELGFRDEQERIRITILRGVMRKNLNAYRVVIGINPDVMSSTPNVRFFALASRINTMEPSTGENLDRFIKSYEVLHEYFFAPAVVVGNLSASPKLLGEYIIKRDIFIRNAWEIGKNDIDRIAVYSNDDIFIPNDEKNPPINKLLQNKKKGKTRKRKR